MKKEYISFISGFLILFGSLLMYTSPIGPLLISLGIIAIINSIFLIKKYSNMTLFIALSSIALILGVIWALYNTTIPINVEHTTSNYILIVIETIAISLIVYSFNNTFKSMKEAVK